MKQERWLRIIPVALIMYTISYVDRTNLTIALDPEKSSMMHDLGLTGGMKGDVLGIFFFGYILLQIPGGALARHWSARKVVSLCLLGWGACAIGCGLSQTFGELKWMRFFLGVAESGVYPATIVLLCNWFPRAERARANVYWNVCQPLAVAFTAPITYLIIGRFHWNGMLIMEGLLPFIWLPIWWFGVRDHPREAKWISPEERAYVEATLEKENAHAESAHKLPLLQRLTRPAIFVMIGLYFLHNCAAYGCMGFFSDSLKGQGFSSLQHGILFAVPYAITAVVMILVSRHSDKVRERRMHIAAVYAVSGICLILSVVFKQYFWVSYAFLCLAIPGPFSGMSPFWANASETLPPSVMGAVIGLVNALGNVGGYAGQKFIGWMTDVKGNTAMAFVIIGIGMLGCTALAFLLPKAPPLRESATA